MKKLRTNEVIRSEMKKRNISQYDLACKLNVCEQTVFRLLRAEQPEEKKAELLAIINKM